MSSLRTRIASTALLMGLSLAAACGDTPTQAGGNGGGTPVPMPTDSAGVASVQLSPDTATLLAAGGHRRLEATVRDRHGYALQGRVVHFASSDLAIATVDGSGNVTAHNPGRAWITASIDGKQAQARVDVLPLTVDSIALTRPWIRVQWGTARSLGAVLYAADGRMLGDRAVAWTTSDSAVATVDALGRVTAIRGGRAWITATSEGRAARAEVIVPDVKVMTLGEVGGDSVPVQVMDSTWVDAQGVRHRVWTVATEGTLRLDSRTGTYEQVVVLRVSTTRVLCTDWGSCVGDPARVEFRTVYDRGDLLYNVFTGEPLFESDVYAGWHYYAQETAGDALTVWQTLPGTGEHLAWLYRLQES